MKNSGGERLSEEETRELIQQCQQHDDAQALTRLVEAHTPLVNSLAKKFYISFQEDLIQEGFIGLIQSVRRFDPAQSNRFSTFAYHYIRGWMLQYLKSKVSVVRHPKGGEAYCFSLDVPVFQGEESIPLVETLRGKGLSPEETIIQKDIATQLNRGMESLSPRERMVVKRHFWEEATLEEVGKELGVSRESVRRLGQDALKHMRQGLLRRKKLRGVRIQARVHKSPMAVVSKTDLSVSTPLNLEHLGIREFFLTSRVGEKSSVHADLEEIRSMLQPNQWCVVRVDRKMVVGDMTRLVHLLAQELRVSRERIIVELVDVV